MRRLPSPEQTAAHPATRRSVWEEEPITANTFTIPGESEWKYSNQCSDIQAMSAEHWIDYTLYIGESGSRETGTSVKDSTKALDEKAPEITGIKSIGETEITYSDKLKIFNYENDIHLIEVNLIADTARTDTSDEAEQTDESTSRRAGRQNRQIPQRNLSMQRQITWKNP